MLEEVPAGVVQPVNVNMTPIRKPIQDIDIPRLKARTEMLGSRPSRMSRKRFLEESVVGNRKIQAGGKGDSNIESYVRTDLPAERRDRDIEDPEAIAKGKQVCGDFLKEVFDRAEKDGRKLTSTEMRGVYEIAKIGYNLLP